MERKQILQTITNLSIATIKKNIPKLFNIRLKQFLYNNKILTNCQYGFRTNVSTVHAVLELAESVSTSIDHKTHCAGVFINLKKAFDTVDHNILLNKIKYYGIRGIANEWLGNYLSSRKQYVASGEHSSTLQDIACGVPQGSVLGPMLFLLYINNLCNLVKFILFADDTNIFCSSDSISGSHDVLNSKLSKLSIWFKVNKLSLNLNKTNYMIFKLRPPMYDLDLMIDNVAIPRVATTKFLGIVKDEKLN